MQYHKKRGFTLIEILVTVAIIGVLTAIAFVAYGSARAKSRDVARVSNINQVMTALQLYRNENKAYPTALVAGQPIAAGSTTYLSSMPANSTPRTDGGCQNKDFHYEAIPGGYQLTFCLGQDTGNLKKGVNVCINGECASAGQLTVQDSDGNTYGTVSLGGQLVISENLRTTTKPDGTCINGGGQPPCPSTPFNNDPQSCPDPGPGPDCSEGAMYMWSAAMNGSTTEGAQGICPAGWHIPSSPELTSLSNYLAASATREYIRWPGNLIHHRIRYHLNDTSGVFVYPVEQAEARYNYHPNYPIIDFPLSGYREYGAESGDEFTDMETISYVTSSSKNPDNSVHSYYEVYGDTQTSTGLQHNTGRDPLHALPVRCFKNI